MSTIGGTQKAFTAPTIRRMSIYLETEASVAGSARVCARVWHRALVAEPGSSSFIGRPTRICAATGVLNLNEEHTKEKGKTVFIRSDKFDSYKPQEIEGRKVRVVEGVTIERIARTDFDRERRESARAFPSTSAAT